MYTREGILKYVYAELRIRPGFNRIRPSRKNHIWIRHAKKTDPDPDMDPNFFFT